jgi:hypothetical protein
MAFAQASLQKAREKAIVEFNDARKRLQEVEAQLVLSEAKTLQEEKAREEVQEEMKFQSLVYTNLRAYTPIGVTTVD